MLYSENFLRVPPQIIEPLREKSQMLLLGNSGC